jgi:arylformamidase
LVDNKVILIGIDYYSIQKFNDPPDVHEILLQNEIIILETIDLRNVVEGNYNLYCAPLKIQGIEGAPCRAILTTI